MYDIKTILTVEFYDNHILLTMICIFWPEFWLNNAVLHYMYRKTENVFRTLFTPFIRDHIDSVDCTLGYKATVGRRSRMKGECCFIKLIRFPLDVIQNSVVSAQILAKIYRPRLKECAYHKIQQYYDQN